MNCIAMCFKHASWLLAGSLLGVPTCIAAVYGLESLQSSSQLSLGVLKPHDLVASSPDSGFLCVEPVANEVH